MQYVQQILFALALGVAIYFFTKKVKQIRRNIFWVKTKKLMTTNQKDGRRWHV